MEKISLTGSLLMTSMSLLSQQFKLPHRTSKRMQQTIIVLLELSFITIEIVVQRFAEFET